MVCEFISWQCNSGQCVCVCVSGCLSGARNTKNSLHQSLGTHFEMYPDLLFLFGATQGKPHKKQGFFLSAEPLESLGKKGITPKKARKSVAMKKARKSQKQGKEDQGNVALHPKLI